MPNKENDNDTWNLWKISKIGKKTSIISFVIILILLVVSAIIDATLETNILDGVVSVVNALFPYWSILSAGVGVTGVAKTVMDKVNEYKSSNNTSEVDDKYIG